MPIVRSCLWAILGCPSQKQIPSSPGEPSGSSPVIFAKMLLLIHAYQSGLDKLTGGGHITFYCWHGPGQAADQKGGTHGFFGTATAAPAGRCFFFGHKARPTHPPPSQPHTHRAHASPTCSGPSRDDKGRGEGEQGTQQAPST